MATRKRDHQSHSEDHNQACRHADHENRPQVGHHRPVHFNHAERQQR